jgi:hypothetical protein
MADVVEGWRPGTDGQGNGLTLHYVLPRRVGRSSADANLPTLGGVWHGKIEPVAQGGHAS